jgi:outer membrane immunogenic protein
MKKILLAAVAVSALAGGSAMAADLPVRAPVYKAPPPVVAYNWTGFYIGANAGGAWSEKCWTNLNTFVTPVAEGCHNPSGFIGGGQIGFNYQTGPVVFGVEFSGDWASLRGSNLSTAFANYTNTTKVGGILLATGRIGYAWDAALLYVKGGGAWAHDKYSAFNPVSGGNQAASEWRGGWTVGAGLEWGFAQNWSVAAEYDYVGLGTRTVGFTGTATFNEDIKQKIQMGTLRLNYRFGAGSPVVARY